jgi:phasin family protein
VIKATLAETEENAQKALSVKDLQELLALQASVLAPVTEKVLSYGRHVNEIASAMRAEFAKVADAQCEALNRRAQALVDDVAKNAPAGSEAVIASMKSAISAANTVYETMHRSTQQAIEMAESNSEAAAAAASRAAQGATAQAARATRK